MDDQMRALVCLKSALILYFEKNEARSNRACIHKNLKNFRLLAIAAFFLKKHYEKTSIAPKNSYLQFSFAAKLLF